VGGWGVVLPAVAADRSGRGGMGGGNRFPAAVLSVKCGEFASRSLSILEWLPTRVVFPVPRSFVSFLSLFRRLSGATQMFAIGRVFF